MKFILLHDLLVFQNSSDTPTSYLKRLILLTESSPNLIVKSEPISPVEAASILPKPKVFFTTAADSK